MTMDFPTQPRAAACPELPRLTAELLWFLSYKREAPQRCVLLGDADVVFAFNHVIYVMRCEDWQHFEAMCQAA